MASQLVDGVEPHLGEPGYFTVECGEGVTDCDDPCERVFDGSERSGFVS